ncbi:MAG: 6-phosphogluconolactonase [Anaerolineales bacterium]
MRPNALVQRYNNIDELSDSAKQAFVEIAKEAIKERGCFLVALSGGSTPVKLYEKLAPEILNWARVHFFWGDERCVPMDDSGNNYGQAKKLLFDKIDIPNQNIHRIPSELEPAEAAVQYSLTLGQFADPPLAWPRFDLVLLGMGDDGHTASLFPGSPVDTEAPTLAVTVNYQDRPAHRVTLTQNVFNSARNIFFLVTGTGKAETLNRVLSNIYTPGELPAQRINPRDGKIIWFVDQAAAHLL